jgi:hypothetical protein
LLLLLLLLFALLTLPLLWLAVLGRAEEATTMLPGGVCGAKVIAACIGVLSEARRFGVSREGAPSTSDSSCRLLFPPSILELKEKGNLTLRFFFLVSR